MYFTFFFFLQKVIINFFTFCIWAGFGGGLPRCAKVTDIFEATTHESSQRWTDTKKDRQSPKGGG